MSAGPDSASRVAVAGTAALSVAVTDVASGPESIPGRVAIRRGRITTGAIGASVMTSSSSSDMPMASASASQRSRSGLTGPLVVAGPSSSPATDPLTSAGMTTGIAPLATIDGRVGARGRRVLADTPALASSGTAAGAAPSPRAVRIAVMPAATA
jgi:hypothetical protein